MSKIFNFLDKAINCQILTKNNKKVHSRPIGSIVEYNDKIYFATDKKQETFKDILKNPTLALFGIGKSACMNVSCDVVLDDTKEAKEAMLKANPKLKTKYDVEDKEFKVFYIDNLKGTLGFEPIGLY